MSGSVGAVTAPAWEASGGKGDEGVDVGGVDGVGRGKFWCTSSPVVSGVSFVQVHWCNICALSNLETSSIDVVLIFIRCARLCSVGVCGRGDSPCLGGERGNGRRGS